MPCDQYRNESIYVCIYIRYIYTLYVSIHIAFYACEVIHYIFGPSVHEFYKLCAVISVKNYIKCSYYLPIL